MLLMRDGPGNRARALALLEESAEDYERLKMLRHARLAEELATRFRKAERSSRRCQNLAGTSRPRGLPAELRSTIHRELGMTRDRVEIIVSMEDCHASAEGNVGEQLIDAFAD